MERTIILVIALAALNVGAIALIRPALKAIDIESALNEKTPQPVAAGAPPLDPMASSSRLIGFVASAVMIAVLWGAGNYLVYAAFFEMEKIPVFLSSISTFFLSGSTLYLPYGANKLSAAVKG